MKGDKMLELVNSLLLAEKGEVLSPIQKIVLFDSWHGHKYSEIAETSDYSEQYIKEVAAQLWTLLSEIFEVKISKRNFRKIIHEQWHTDSDSSKQLRKKIGNKKQDWGDAPDTSIFFGRDQELKTLKQWIISDHCRLVVILGIGGIGKTSLSIRLGQRVIEKTKSSLKLAQSIQNEFDYIIWRSLLSEPPIKEILKDLIQFLSNQQETDLSNKSVEDKISLLLNYLRQNRCLIILDNAESILQGRDNKHYRQTHEQYGQLFKKIGEVSHQSCLLLTSREKLPELALLEGDARPVRSLQLGGLDELSIKKLFRTIGEFSVSEKNWKQLIEIYDGNPLTLELAARHIQTVFAGSISEFIEKGKQVFSSIQELLKWHFDRLSDYEQEIMYWLAINRDPASIIELQEDIVSLEAREKVSETIQLLQRRLPLEKRDIKVFSHTTHFLQEVVKEIEVIGFQLQPVLIEYTLERLVREIVKELQTGEIKLFNEFALLKATTKDSVRESQRNLILNPLLDKLIYISKSIEIVQENLNNTIKKIQKKLLCKSGYTTGNVINLLCQINKDLSNYNFSNLHIQQAYLQGIKLEKTDFSNSHITKSIFTNTLSSVLSVGLNVDGNVVVTGDSKGNIRLWNIADGKQLLKFVGHNNWVWSVKFSPREEIIASASDDTTVKLWEAKTGKCLFTLKDHTNWVRTVAFSPDGQILASGSDDTTVRLWNVQTGKCLRILKGHTMRIWSIAFSPDGQLLASGSNDQTIRVWNVQTGKLIKVLRAHRGRVQAVTFSHDGQKLASGSADSTVRIWDSSTFSCINVLVLEENLVWDIAFNSDNKTIAVASDDKTVAILDIYTGEYVKTFLGHESRIWSIAFSSNGQKLASGSDDKTVKIWDVHTSQCLQTFRGQTNRVWSVAFSPDGQKLASGSEDKNVRIWNVGSNSNYECIKVFQEYTNWVWSIAFSPDSKTLAIGSDDTIVKIWDIETCKCVKQLKGHNNWVLSVAFNLQDDGKTLASGSEDATVRIWNIETEECLMILEEHTDRVRSVAFSFDGQTLASGSDDSTIRIWDINTGECKSVLTDHCDRVRSVAFNSSTERKLFASGSDDKTVKIWDAETFELLRTLQDSEGHTDKVGSIAFTPDGQLVASGSDDTTVRIWNVDTGKCEKILKKHSNWVRSLAFNPIDFSLASSSQDETIILWNLDTGDWKTNPLRAPGPYEGMKIIGVTGLTDAEKSTLLALGAIADTD